MSGLWQDGKNSESWLTTIDRALGGDGSGAKLSAAWADFAKAYLIDHALWPGSTGWGQVNMAAALSSTIAFSTAAHLPKKKVRLKAKSLRAPPLSGGGFALDWRPGAGEAATFVVKLEPRSGAGYWGRFPGNSVNGRPGTELAEVSGGGQVQRAQLTDVFVLGAKEDRPDHKPPLLKERATRYVYYYTDTSLPAAHRASRIGAQQNAAADMGGMSFEVWAIPEVTGVTSERVPPAEHLLKLTWARSALEREKDLFGGYEVLVRVPKREDKVLDKLDADTLEYQVDAAKHAAADSARLCVRVVDVDGTAGPAGCASLGGSWKLVRRGIASKIQDRDTLSYKYPRDFEDYGPAGVLDAEFADDCEQVVGHLEFTIPEELTPDEVVAVPFSLTGSGQWRDQKKCGRFVVMPGALGTCGLGSWNRGSHSLSTRPGMPGSATNELRIPSFESFKKTPPGGQAELREDERDMLIIGCTLIAGEKRVHLRYYYAFDSGAGP